MSNSFALLFALLALLVLGESSGECIRAYRARKMET